MGRELATCLTILLLNGTAHAVADLAAAWDFDAVSGATAPDTSGNGNTGTLGGNAQAVVDTRGPALLFPSAAVAVAPVMSVLAGPGTNLHEFTNGLTLEAFVKPEVLPIPPGPTGLRLRYVISADDDVYSPYLRVDDAGNTVLGGAVNCGRSPSGTADVGATASFPNTLAGTFSHVALTFAAGELRLFLNGAEIAHVTDAGAPPCGSHVGPVSTL